MTDEELSGAENAEKGNQKNRQFLAGHMGVEFKRVENGYVEAELAVKQHHLAPNGYLHAGSVVTLADSACGYGCLNSLPENAVNFTTVELKSNFLSTATSGAIACKAKAVHKGRTTQIWDAEVVSEKTGRKIALFRCTQMILY